MDALIVDYTQTVEHITISQQRMQPEIYATPTSWTQLRNICAIDVRNLNVYRDQDDSNTARYGILMSIAFPITIRLTLADSPINHFGHSSKMYTKVGSCNVVLFKARRRLLRYIIQDAVDGHYAQTFLNCRSKHYGTGA
ncbi:unnamed protein product [Toxocara canis]|uniref:Uncharacterized protein n=1 Tax=Toxocara canis TaxID=6265 RepID=A0A183UZE6_TOXCA|nr:unnamed protein product [Toxocara canis]